MTHIAARSAESRSQFAKLAILRGCLKSVARVVTMLQANMAWYAQIVVFADSAGDEVGLLKYCKTSVMKHKAIAMRSPTLDARIAGTAQIR